MVTIEEALRQRLDLLMKTAEIVNNKVTRAEIRDEIAQNQCQLGIISDNEFKVVERFLESLNNELGQQFQSKREQRDQSTSQETGYPRE
ncbi:MAG: hypothetical protein IPK19_33265 [Chloroflexi bacterium]|nr:hypothetical protein [Chloroflexota bacterium]